MLSNVTIGVVTKVLFSFPGGFAPPAPPTPSLAGAPVPRSAPVARFAALASLFRESLPYMLLIMRSANSDVFTS